MAVNCRELTMPNTASWISITHSGWCERPSSAKLAIARPTSSVLATSTVR